MRRAEGDWGGAFAAAIGNPGAPPPHALAAAAALAILPQFLAAVLPLRYTDVHTSLRQYTEAGFQYQYLRLELSV